jgi:hypothetical protein
MNTQISYPATVYKRGSQVSMAPSQGDGVLSGTGFIMGKTQTHIDNCNKVDNATQSSMQMC